MRIGILGTGQLGRMMGVAAHRLGTEPVMYGPKSGPACDVARASVIAPWDDLDAVRRFAEQVSVVTYELEQLPVETARAAAEVTVVRPRIEALLESQDRLREKSLFRRLGLKTPSFVAVNGPADARVVTEQVGYPCLLKRTQGGYDGKGQAKVGSEAEVTPALEELAGPCIAERFISWRREVSVIAVRGQEGEVAFYDPVENRHEGGILRVSRVPASGLDAAARAEVQDIARALLEALDYVGVLTVELFDTDEGWLVNEIAPRVHNSGHWSIEGAEISQFENHVRAVLGLPLGSTRSRGPTAMVNLIGEVPEPDKLLAVPGAAVHLYGKTPAPGRKLGHVTIVGRDDDELEERLARVRAVVADVPEALLRAGGVAPSA